MDVSNRMMKSAMQNISLVTRAARRISVMLAIAAMVLAGCQSTQTNVKTVGPSIGGTGSSTELGNAQRSYNYTSNIYLDVAIPVFDPGIPLDSNGHVDDKKVADEDIWPQVRRLEANRFAIETKKSLAKTKAFGAINITPDANVSADVYILGKINYSDTETVKIGIRVMDTTNEIWGEKEFEHRVGAAFYRDALRKEQNPYAPVFDNIAAYVYDLLIKKSEKDKQAIQQVSDLRYAAMYSPEVFSPYLKQKTGFFSRQAVYSLNGLPSEQDPMLQRIKQLQAKDEQFIDQLQDSYEAFYAETEDAYSHYQRETLPIAADIRKKKAERAAQQALALGGTVLAVLLSKNSNSGAGQVGAVVAGAAAVYSLSEAIQTNRALSAQREVLSEMGQNLDIKVTTQVVEMNDQTIELKGTAGEQHTQLRHKLYEIYQLESTPDRQL